MHRRLGRLRALYACRHARSVRLDRGIGCASPHRQDFNTFRAKLIERGHNFAERSLKCRERIAQLALDFVQDGATILVHCYSRVVMALLLHAAKYNRRFRVLVTEAKPTSKGFTTARILRHHGIPADVILDAAVAYYMEKVDLVLVGAEGVVENGGIINQVRARCCLMRRIDRDLLDGGHGQGC